MRSLLKKRWLRRILVTLFWLVIWQLASLLVHNSILLSSPLETIVTLVLRVQQLPFWSAIGFSFVRIVGGFLIALLAGLLLGLLAWRQPLVGEILNPFVTFVKSVPIVCFIVLLLIWFGSPWVSLTAVFLVAFPAFYFACREGLENRNRQLFELLKVFDLGRKDRLLVFHWPSIRPFIQATAKIAVGMSWKSGVAAELIELPLGSIGARIYQAKITLSSADIFAWTFVLVGLSLLCEKLFLLALDRSEDWAWHWALPRWQHDGIKTGLAETPAQPASQKIVLSDLAKSYDDHVILRSLNQTLDPGTRWALQEPSGAGKTTLLRILAGLEKADAGTLQNPNKTAMLFQESRLFEKRNALENLQLLVGRTSALAEIRRTLEGILPAESLELPTSQLSGGMRRRVELVRALLAPAGLVLLDEPYSGLDVETAEQARRLTDRLLAGRTLVLASHDSTDARTLQAKDLGFCTSAKR